jgi:hypothetical protein
MEKIEIDAFGKEEMIRVEVDGAALPADFVRVAHAPGVDLMNQIYGQKTTKRR